MAVSRTDDRTNGLELDTHRARTLESFFGCPTRPDGSTAGVAVFTIAADGSDEVALTTFDSFAGAPDWSPDGEWIVYSTHRPASSSAARSPTSTGCIPTAQGPSR